MSDGASSFCYFDSNALFAYLLLATYASVGGIGYHLLKTSSGSYVLFRSLNHCKFSPNTALIFSDPLEKLALTSTSSFPFSFLFSAVEFLAFIIIFFTSSVPVHSPMPLLANGHMSTFPLAN
jgi:hypothetical protein